MSLRTKLTILELITGIFGWIWIGASLASVYYLAIVMFSTGTWSSFFWALGISIVSKWLAKGFDDSKKRVAFEAHLRDQGYSVAEAGEIWFQQYTGVPEIKNVSDNTKK